MPAGFPIVVQIGAVYGYLTVLAEAPRSASGERRLLCRCRCGAEKVIDMNSVRRGRTTSCGCKSKEPRKRTLTERLATANRTRPLAERFHDRVDHTAGPDGCWPWLGAQHVFGYGKFFVKKINKRAVFEDAHRMAWILANGPIQEGMVVRHDCDNPPCCNPQHLRIGTMADNARDMAERNRGHGSGRWKLSNEEADEARRRHEAGESLRSIGRHFGVSNVAIANLVRGYSLNRRPDRRPT